MTNSRGGRLAGHRGVATAPSCARTGGALTKRGATISSTCRTAVWSPCTERLVIETVGSAPALHFPLCHWAAVQTIPRIHTDSAVAARSVWYAATHGRPLGEKRRVAAPVSRSPAHLPGAFGCSGRW